MAYRTLCDSARWRPLDVFQEPATCDSYGTTLACCLSCILQLRELDALGTDIHPDTLRALDTLNNLLGNQQSSRESVKDLEAEVDEHQEDHEDHVDSDEDYEDDEDDEADEAADEDADEDADVGDQDRPSPFFSESSCDELEARILQAIHKAFLSLWTHSYHKTTTDSFPDPTIQYVIISQLLPSGFFRDPSCVTGQFARLTWGIVSTYILSALKCPANTLELQSESHSSSTSLNALKTPSSGKLKN